MKNTTYCTSCGAEFDAKLPACPYCGTMNYQAAEAEYLKKLENVREDLEDLQDLPEEETKKEFKKQGKFLKKTFIILGILMFLLLAWEAGNKYLGKLEDKREMQKTAEWIKQYKQPLEDLYQQKKYEDMTSLYQESLDIGNPPIGWKYADFIYYCNWIKEGEEAIEEERTTENNSKKIYPYIFFCEWKFFKKEYEKDKLNQEQLDYIIEKSQPLLEDFEQRWQLKPEQIEELEKIEKKNYGYLPYDDITKFVYSNYDI